MSRMPKQVDRKSIKIRAVVPASEEYVLRIAWDDGSSSRVDLTELIFRLKHLRPLRNKKRFKDVSVSDWGWAISWGDELDVSVETLHRMAIEQASAEMTPAGFRAWLTKHRLTQQSAATLLGLSKRSIAYYATGAQPVTRTVALAIRGAMVAPRKPSSAARKP